MNNSLAMKTALLTVVQPVAQADMERLSCREMAGVTGEDYLMNSRRP